MIANALEVIGIFLSSQSKKREVVAFLDELHKLLESDDFDINTDLNLIRKKKQGENQKQVVCVSFHYAKDKMEFPYA